MFVFFFQKLRFEVFFPLVQNPRIRDHIPVTLYEALVASVVADTVTTKTLLTPILPTYAEVSKLLASITNLFVYHCILQNHWAGLPEDDGVLDRLLLAFGQGLNRF